MTAPGCYHLKMPRGQWAVGEVAGPGREPTVPLGLLMGASVASLALVPATLGLADAVRDHGPASGWILWAWGLFSTAGLWAAFFWTRRRAHDVVSDVAPSELLSFDPGLVAVMSFVTLGLYAIYWNWVSTHALRRITGRRRLRPGMEVALSILTMGVFGIYVQIRNAVLVDRLVDPVQPSNVRWQVVGLYLASFFWPLCAVGAWYRLAEGYREVARLGGRCSSSVR